MRILHVWDVAGVSCVLAKYQRKLGHKVEVFMRDGLDHFGIHKFYGLECFKGSALGFYRHAIRQSKNCDIVHLHSSATLVPFISKPKVLHFHGSDFAMAGLFKRFVNWVAIANVDKVLVSTPDMKRFVPNSEWLHHAVDTDHFYPRKCLKPEFEGKNLIYRMGGYPRAFELEGTDQPIQYEDMPDYLLAQTVYLEPKNYSVCKIGLEALACGIPVIYNGLWIKPPLPKMYHGLEVAKETIRIYYDVLDSTV